MDLSDYNFAGIIPGPKETEEEFNIRALYCLNLKKQIPEMLEQDIPFSSGEIDLTDEILKAGYENARQLYDIFPTWVPVFFSNYKLSFWQGGCAWIFQQKENSPTAAFFQLRQNFRHSKKYLGLYERNELISHELSHVGRMMYEEPKFEEILAYRSSPSKLRSFLGPIVQSSYESTIFVLFLFCVIMLDVFTIAGGISYLSLTGRLIILGMIVYSLLRLAWRHKQFETCFEHLKSTFSNSQQANAVIYRLTDKEIISFGHFTSAQIHSYAEKQKDQSYRWKVLYEAYFKKLS